MENQEGNSETEEEDEYDEVIIYRELTNTNEVSGACSIAKTDDKKSKLWDEITAQCSDHKIEKSTEKETNEQKDHIQTDAERFKLSQCKRREEIRRTVKSKKIKKKKLKSIVSDLLIELEGKDEIISRSKESLNRLLKKNKNLMENIEKMQEAYSSLTKEKEEEINKAHKKSLDEEQEQLEELQLLLSKETILESDGETYLQQVRYPCQLHRDEPRKEHLLRRELADKQAHLEEQQRQLEEERLRGTGLEEELRQLLPNLVEERESRLEALEEIQKLRSELTAAQESYNHRLRESERIASEYEQRLQELRSALTAAQQSLDEYRRQEPRDWIIRRDEVTITDKILGVGGWGNVVEGRFRGSEVAVKQIHELILSTNNRRLFEREMSIASRCRHPCLLQFIGATNDDGTPLFVTELLDTDLRSVLSQRSLLHEEIITIARDIAKALNYLHLNRPSPIIHRDISSANVLLWKRENCWRAKLSDYGAANFMQQSMTKGPGARIYAAPEAMTNQQSPKIDVYSFGLLLCEMCTRELPVPQQTQEQIRLVTNGVLRELVMRCVQTDHESRPSIAEVITDLDRCMEQ